MNIYQEENEKMQEDKISIYKEIKAVNLKNWEVKKATKIIKQWTKPYNNS